MVSIRRSLSSVLLWLFTPGFCYCLVPSLQHDIHVPHDTAVLPGEAWKAAGQSLETLCVSCRYQCIPRKEATEGIQLHEWEFNLNVDAHRSGLPVQSSAHPPRAVVGTRMVG